MNEETIIEKRPNANGQNEKKQEEETWKYVTLGGIPGILLGAGMLYTGQVSAQMLSEDDVEVPSEEASVDASYLVPDSLNVAQVSDNMSFGEAFAAARAQVGPGGVFYWHGGVYGTYYAEEWDAMSAQDKNEYAMRVQPAINANEIASPTDDHPDIVVYDNDVQEAEAQLAEQLNENFDMGDDVHIVGYANYQDHLVVGYDTDNDGAADVAIIDVDDNFAPTPDDIVVNNRGDAATLGDLVDSEQQYLSETEGPDVAADSSDYTLDTGSVDVLI